MKRTDVPEVSVFGFRFWICAGLGLLALEGCGHPTQPGAATTTQAVGVTHPADGAQPAGTSTSDPESAENLRLRAAAQEAFATLTAQDITAEQWEAAQEKLLAMGPSAVPVLAEGLKSSEVLPREMAASLLALLGPQSAAAEDALVAALNDESTFVRANAATALCLLPGHEEQVIPVLAALLESDDPQLRRMAATNLGNFGPEAVPIVPRLTAALDDGEPEVLLPLVQLLGRIGAQAQGAAPKLKQIAFEQTGEVSAAATAALEQIEAAAP
jgi:HEAT repeat protein